jgi:hypothetical protein
MKFVPRTSMMGMPIEKRRIHSPGMSQTMKAIFSIGAGVLQWNMISRMKTQVVSPYPTLYMHADPLPTDDGYSTDDSHSTHNRRPTRRSHRDDRSRHEPPSRATKACQPRVTHRPDRARDERPPSPLRQPAVRWRDIMPAPHVVQAPRRDTGVQPGIEGTALAVDR